MHGETQIGGPEGYFPRTPWSRLVVLPDDHASKRAALSELAVRYWKPLYFFARRKGHGVEAAKDGVQGFLVSLLERDTLERLDPARGRLRSFLRTAFANYLLNEHERTCAQKRGGGVLLESLDLEAAEGELVDAAPGPEAALDREWALGILESALDRLRREFEDGRRGGDGADFELVRQFFGASPPSYEDAARDAGIGVPRLKSLLFRARARYRELVRSQVATTVAELAETDRELDDLLGSLRA